MTSPTTSIPTTYVAASGDRNVDALLGLVKWGGAVGTGAGIDTASFTGIAKDFALTRTGTGFTVTANKGTEGTDTLTSVERLHFTDPATHTDSYLALDLDGNAAEVAKILGAVFGIDSLNHPNPSYAGIGLGYADGGMSYADLMQLALSAAGATTNTAVVDRLYTNVVGTAPDANTEASYVGLLQNGTYTPAALGVMAADTSQNQTNIGLTGLVDHGLAFIPG